MLGHGLQKISKTDQSECSKLVYPQNNPIQWSGSPIHANNFVDPCQGMRHSHHVWHGLIRYWTMKNKNKWCLNIRRRGLLLGWNEPYQNINSVGHGHPDLQIATWTLSRQTGTWSLGRQVWVGQNVNRLQTGHSVDILRDGHLVDKFEYSEHGQS